MQSVLVTGGIFSERIEKVNSIFKININSQQRNLLVISCLEGKKAISIEEVRKIKNFVARSPNKEEINIVVIVEANKLSLPAQNALLKTLEEPPLSAQIILTCHNESLLLSTVVSRCKIVKLVTKPNVRDQSNNVGSLLDNLTPSNVLDYFAENGSVYASTDNALQFLALVENTLSTHTNNFKSLQILKKIYKYKPYIYESNVPIRFVLENIFLA